MGSKVWCETTRSWHHRSLCKDSSASVRLASCCCVWATFHYICKKKDHMSSLPPLCPKSRWRTESSQLSTDAGCHLLHVYICSKKLSPYNVHGCILKPCRRHQGDSYEFFKDCKLLIFECKKSVACWQWCVCLIAFASLLTSHFTVACTPEV